VRKIDTVLFLNGEELRRLSRLNVTRETVTNVSILLCVPLILTAPLLAFLPVHMLKTNVLSAVLIVTVTTGLIQGLVM